MNLDDKQARPIFRIFAGVISLVFYLFFIIQSIIIFNFIRDDVFTWAFLIKPLAFLSFLPIAIAFTYLSITGCIPETLLSLLLGRKHAGMKTKE